VEAGEALVAAVVRELAEETGLDGVCGPLLGWAERMGVDHHFVILDFHVEVFDDGPAAAGSDASDVAWAPLQDVHGWNLVDGLLDFLVDHGVVEGGLAGVTLLSEDPED